MAKWCNYYNCWCDDIEILEDYLDKQDRKFVSEYRLMILEAIENLIQRNKDLEQIEQEHKEENGRLREELDKKENTINLMAEQLTTPVHSKKWVIDYFTNKVEEDIKE